MKSSPIFALLLLLMLTSCRSTNTTPVFATEEPMYKDYRVPVDKVWKDTSVSLARYDKIMIPPVVTNLQLDQSFLEEHSFKSVTGIEDDDLRDMATYMRKSFISAIQDNPCRMTVTDVPGPRTLRLELAITKLTCDSPLMETGTTVGMAFINPWSLCMIPFRSAAEKEARADALIVVEGKVVDSQTGDLLVLFQVSGKQDLALVDVNKYTDRYANVKAIINGWSKLLVEAINKRPLETDTTIAPVTKDNGVSVIRY